MLDKDPELDLQGLNQMIFTKLYCVLERVVSVKDVENRLEENDCRILIRVCII